MATHLHRRVWGLRHPVEEIRCPEAYEIHEEEEEEEDGEELDDEDGDAVDKPSSSPMSEEKYE